MSSFLISHLEPISYESPILFSQIVAILNLAY